MVKIKDIARFIEQIAPLSLQEEYDNAGLIIGNAEDETPGCLVCLDVTEKILEEAAGNHIRLIISHHPVIFGKINRITGQTPTERIIERAIRENISIYAVHTNLDNVVKGVNHMFGTKLGLKNLQILRRSKGLLRKLVTFCPNEHAISVREAIFAAGAGTIGHYDQCSFNAEGTGTFRGNEETNPFVGRPGELHFEKETRIETVFPYYLEKEVIRALLDAHPYEEVAYDIYKLENDYDKAGIGMTGELENPMTETEFLGNLKKIMMVPCIRHSELLGKMVRKVAVCGGSGSFLIPDAISQEADFFVTSDIKYHQFQQADGRIVIADVGHFESEQFTCELLAEQLMKKFPKFAVFISKIPVNPVNYF